MKNSLFVSLETVLVGGKPVVMEEVSAVKRKRGGGRRGRREDQFGIFQVVAFRSVHTQDTHNNAKQSRVSSPVEPVVRKKKETGKNPLRKPIPPLNRIGVTRRRRTKPSSLFCFFRFHLMSRCLRLRSSRRVPSQSGVPVPG